MANERTNPTPELTEYLDGDYDGDFLGGLMANIDIVRSRFPRQADIFIAPHSTGENALEVIGPDNFRGAPLRSEEAVTAEVGIDNFRGNPAK